MLEQLQDVVDFFLIEFLVFSERSGHTSTELNCINLIWQSAKWEYLLHFDLVYMNIRGNTRLMLDVVPALFK